jgi:hypothetical protein
LSVALKGCVANNRCWTQRFSDLVIQAFSLCTARSRGPKEDARMMKLHRTHVLEEPERVAMAPIGSIPPRRGCPRHRSFFGRCEKKHYGRQIYTLYFLCRLGLQWGRVVYAPNDIRFYYFRAPCVPGNRFSNLLHWKCTMTKAYNIPSSYRCAPGPHGTVQIFNEHSYVMGEYTQATGITKWQRVVAAGQRATIEQWLSEHYPVPVKTVSAPAKPKRKAAAA